MNRVKEWQMSRLWDNRLVKNRFGQVRSGWIILIAMAAYDRLSLVSSIGIIEVLRKILIATCLLYTSDAADEL